MKLTKIFSVLALAATVSSCAITQPLEVTNNKIGTKSGESIGYGYKGVASGVPTPVSSLMKRATVSEAAKNGNIKTIGCVDVTYYPFNLLGKYKIVVTGE